MSALDYSPANDLLIQFCRDLAPSQTGHFTFAAEQWLDGEGKKESLDFVKEKLELVLQGDVPSPSEPPEVDLLCSHLLEVGITSKNRIQVRSADSGSYRPPLHNHDLSTVRP